MRRSEGWRRYVVATRRERLEWWLMPKVCAVIGHKERLKMYDVMCDRCSVVLRRRTV